MARATRLLLVLAAGACASHGARPPELDAIRPPPFELVYAGTTELEGDSARPDARRAVKSALRVLSGGADRLLVEQRTWSDGDDAPPRLDATLVRGDHVWRRTSDASGGGGFVELTGDAATEARRFAELPWRAQAPLAGGSGESDLRREQWRAHPRLGDLLETARFGGVKLVEGRPVASRIAFERFGDFDAQRADLALDTARAAPDEVRDLEPPTAAARAGSPALAGAVRLEPLAPGVELVDDPASSLRPLAVAFADHLVVVEAPESSASGERVVDALAAAHAGSPIRDVLFSHHHARFCGGLRAFLAEGAAIVTTPDDRAFVEATVTRPFTLAPDRLAHRGGRLHLETFDAGRRFADATNELDALKLGAASRHTDDYVIFWLPRARLLYVGDLAWTGFERGAPVVGASGRALADFVAAQRLDVATIVQALRVGGGPAALPFADWLRAVPTTAPAAPSAAQNR